MNIGRHYGYAIPKSIAVNYKDFKIKRDAVIKRLNGVYENNWSKENIDLVHGRARFVAPGTVEVLVSSSRQRARYTAPHILIATGGKPNIPDIPGALNGITSDGFFEMEDLPPKLAIVGAGYIAVELAGVMAAVNVETHMFIRGQNFLRKFDPMIQKSMTEKYEASGIFIHRGHPGFKEVQLLQSGKDVKLNDSGHVMVDQFQNTSTEGIYALGGVTGQAELTPVAIAAGRQLSNRIFGPSELKFSKLSYENIPTVVFAHPEVGSIGLTEPQARERHGNDLVKIYHSKFTAMFYDVVPVEEKAKNPTEMKLICLQPEEKIVGMHILGLGVAEMLQGFGVALKMGATKEDFDNCVAIHPTSAEGLVTMR
ncbi:hypothetical protein N7486_005969 [Penicillium sp. IBT 16267x]|nr:hypothetical protein N7486_005969 [Penicillium sp. IBT 16267x]